MVKLVRVEKNSFSDGSVYFYRSTLSYFTGCNAGKEALKACSACSSSESDPDVSFEIIEE